MTRHEWLWLVLKALGIYFLINGIVSLVTAVSVTNAVGQLSSMTGQLWLPTLASLAIGAYLTFGGEWLLGMAALTMPADEPEEELSSDESEEASDDEAQKRRRQLARIRRRRLRHRRS